MLLVEFLLFAFASSAKLAPIVKLTAGKVVGITQEVDNATIHLYQGIRYGTYFLLYDANTKLLFDFFIAHAPRFVSPTRVPAWSGVYEAVQRREMCPQPIILPQTLNGSWVSTNTSSEDCLFLSIWKPENATERINEKPVMVFIHGIVKNT